MIHCAIKVTSNSYIKVDFLNFSKPRPISFHLFFYQIHCEFSAILTLIVISV